MNKSNLVHAGFALAFQIPLGLLTGNWWYGVCLTALFWGREHAQKQDNIADASHRKVKDLPAWEGADMTKWSKDSLLDFFAPLLATLSLALFMTY